MDSDPLSTLPPLREVIDEFGLRAEKSLGQNFILDQNLTDRIVRLAGDLSQHHIVEIGPGPGGLTRSILRACPAHLSAIEYDERAIKALHNLNQAFPNTLSLIHDDALHTSPATLRSDMRCGIIANLPYNIATPLLLNWLREIRNDRRAYEFMILMFQKEVAQRIVAQPGTKAYGRLSVISQWLCKAEIAFDISSKAFVPPPKVTSSVVVFKPKARVENDPEFTSVEKLTAAAFGQRRKMIRSSLKNYANALLQSGLEETRRAETLSVEDFLTLASLIDIN